MHAFLKISGAQDTLDSRPCHNVVSYPSPRLTHARVLLRGRLVISGGGGGGGGGDFPPPLNYGPVMAASRLTCNQVSSGLNFSTWPSPVNSCRWSVGGCLVRNQNPLCGTEQATACGIKQFLQISSPIGQKAIIIDLTFGLFFSCYTALTLSIFLNCHDFSTNSGSTVQHTSSA